MWGHEDKVGSVSIKKAPNDYGVIALLHSILSKADVIIHHNGDSFDLKKFNARAVKYGFTPIPPILQIDTLKIARKHFKFTSNRLDYLGEFLGCGRKIDTPKGLWRKATEGDREAIKEMVSYNKQDVLLLKEVYQKLKPYTPAKLNLNQFIDSPEGTKSCNSCGSANTVRQGTKRTVSRVIQRFQCKECGHWFQ